jgi:hypothetical protein
MPEQSRLMLHNLNCFLILTVALQESGLAVPEKKKQTWLARLKMVGESRGCVPVVNSSVSNGTTRNDVPKGSADTSIMFATLLPMRSESWHKTERVL